MYQVKEKPPFRPKPTPKTSTPTGQRTPLGCVEKANRGKGANAILFLFYFGLYTVFFLFFGIDRGANASENGEKQPLLPFSSR